MESTKYCFTNWNELLKVNSVRDGIVSVSNPDAVDVGQDISINDVKTFYAGWRLKDRKPQEGERCVVMLMDGTLEEAFFINNSFGIRTLVLMWGEHDQPFWND